MVSLGFAELGPWDKVKDVVSHFFLPVTALLLVNLPVLVRHVRASLIDVLQAPFIQAARRPGIPERRLLFRHALRAAANPLISLLGLSVAALLSASLVDRNDHELARDSVPCCSRPSPRAISIWWLAR